MPEHLCAQESRLSKQPAIQLFNETGDGPQSLELIDLDSDMDLDIVVVQGGSDNVNIFLNDGSGSFNAIPGTPFSVGNLPTSVTAGDFTGDGHLDLSTSNSISNDISILIGDGSGTFDDSVAPISAGDGPDDISAKDVNADGIVDLIVANAFSDSVSVFIGDGLGGFSSAAGSPVPVGNAPDAVVAAKINGDLHDDLAVANGSSDDVTILLGNGSGGFSPAPNSPFAVGDRPRDLVVADFNGDEIPDLATANSSSFGGGTVSVLLGNGIGGFTESVGSPISTGDSTRSIASIDFNGDGNLDLITVNAFSDDVSILLGDGTGQFTPSPQSPLEVFNIPQSIAVGDFDRDDNSDFVIAHSLANRLSLYTGDGQGAFAESSASPIVLGINPVATALGDFDGDGRLDAAVARFSQDDVLILKGLGGAKFSPIGLTPRGGSTPIAIVSGDFDSDGNLDLATVNSDSNDVSVLTGDGNGGFSIAGSPSFSAGQIPQDIASGDANSDGNPDLFVAGFFSGDVSVHLGDGMGAFMQATDSPIALGGRSSAVEVSDLDNDGDLDIVVVNSQLEAVHVLLGDNSGSFSETPDSPIAVGRNPRSIAVANLNADSFPDIVIGNAADGTVSVLLGSGAGNFSDATGGPFPAGLSPWRVSVADVNNDAVVDILSADQGGNGIVVLIGDGSGSFSQANNSPFALDAPPVSIDIGDIDEDGRSDVFVTTDGPNTPDETIILLTSDILLLSDFDEPSVAQ